MVSVAAVMDGMRRVGEIAEADAHVVDGRAGHANGDGDAQDGMRHHQRVQIAIAQEVAGRTRGPRKRDHSQNRVRKVGERKQAAAASAASPGRA